MTTKEIAEKLTKILSEEEKKDLSSGENKESELLATSLIVTNLPNELFFQQELKVLLSS